MTVALPAELVRKARKAAVGGRARGGAAVRVLEGAATAVFVSMLLWAPLPYASNRPWSWSLLAAAAGLVLALLGAARMLSREDQALPVPVLLAGVLFAAAASWAWLQVAPAVGLPRWLPSHPFWDEAARAGLPVEPMAALAVDGARDAAMRLLAYGGMFWAAFLLLRDPQRARRVLVGFLALASLLSAYGLLNHFAGWNTVLWEDQPKANIGFVNATFINRNNFATYVNMAVLAVLVLLLEPFLRAGSLGDLRRIAAEAVAKLLEKRGPLLLVLVLLVSASLLTASRGGMVSLVVALVALVLIVMFMTRPPLTVLVPATALGCLTVWALVSATGNSMVERFEYGQDGLRLSIYQDTLDMIADRPLLGHGYGSYGSSFLRYQNRSAGPLTVDKAHNTYLEHAAELGIPATVLLYLAPLLLFLFCLRGAFVRRKEKVFPLLAVSATVLVAVHSLMDFSLQIPAVAVTYAMILGMGTAQSIPSLRSSAPGASLR